MVHFDTLASRPIKAWREGANTKLPDTVRIRHACPVTPNFHARFSARARTYRYVLHSSVVRSALMSKNVSWTKYQLDMDRMQEAALHLCGEPDFSSFRARLCQAASPIRDVKHIRFVRCGEFIVMEIKATAFLYNMVRNIVGVLLEVGRGARAPEWVTTVLEAKSRAAAATTAPPHGLYFVGVDYPDFPDIVSQPFGPEFIASWFVDS